MAIRQSLNWSPRPSHSPCPTKCWDVRGHQHARDDTHPHYTVNLRIMLWAQETEQPGTNSQYTEEINTWTLIWLIEQQEVTNKLIITDRFGVIVALSPHKQNKRPAHALLSCTFSFITPWEGYKWDQNEASKHVICSAMNVQVTFTAQNKVTPMLHHSLTQWEPRHATLQKAAVILWQRKQKYCKYILHLLNGNDSGHHSSLMFNSFPH